MYIVTVCKCDRKVTALIGLSCTICTLICLHYLSFQMASVDATTALSPSQWWPYEYGAWNQRKTQVTVVHTSCVNKKLIYVKTNSSNMQVFL